MNFSIGIRLSLMDPIDSIGAAFYTLIQHGRNCSKYLTNRTWTFPSESVRVQRIRRIPSERFSTPSSNISELFRSLARIEHGLFHRNRFVSNGLPPLEGLCTSTLPVFRSRARGYDLNLVGSNGQPSRFWCLLFGITCWKPGHKRRAHLCKRT